MQEIFHALGLEPGILAVNIAGFVLLVVLLKRFAFGPIGEILDDRAREVEANLAEAERARQMALADKRAMEEQLSTLDRRADEIVAEAERRAEQERARILEHAAQESRRIVEDGERRVQSAAEEARRQLRAETAAMAVEVSLRALREAMDERRQAALVDAFIDDIERIAAGGSKPR